jgi:hypothetical protein
MQAILHDRIPIADVVNAQVITLEDAPKAIPIWTREQTSLGNEFNTGFRAEATSLGSKFQGWDHQ